MFATCSLLILPFIWIYGSYDYFDGSPNESLNKFMLGNMGASSTTCNQIPFGIEEAELMLNCKSGHLDPWAEDTKRGPNKGKLIL